MVVSDAPQLPATIARATFVSKSLEVIVPGRVALAKWALLAALSPETQP